MTKRNVEIQVTLEYSETDKLRKNQGHDPASPPGPEEDWHENVRYTLGNAGPESRYHQQWLSKLLEVLPDNVNGNPNRWWRVTATSITGIPTKSNELINQKRSEKVVVVGPIHYVHTQNSKGLAVPSDLPGITIEDGFWHLDLPFNERGEIPRPDQEQQDKGPDLHQIAGVKRPAETPGEEVVETAEGVEMTAQVHVETPEEVVNTATTLNADHMLASGTVIEAFDEAGVKFEITIV